MRKEAGFEVMDHIVVYAQGNDKIESVLLAHKEEISHDVLANDIVTGKTEGYTKEWSINKEQVKLGVEKVQEGNA